MSELIFVVNGRPVYAIRGGGGGEGGGGGDGGFGGDGFGEPGTPAGPEPDIGPAGTDPGGAGSVGGRGGVGGDSPGFGAPGTPAGPEPDISPVGTNPGGSPNGPSRDSGHDGSGRADRDREGFGTPGRSATARDIAAGALQGAKAGVSLGSLAGPAGMGLGAIGGAVVGGGIAARGTPGTGTFDPRGAQLGILDDSNPQREGGLLAGFDPRGLDPTTGEFGGVSRRGEIDYPIATAATKPGGDEGGEGGGGGGGAGAGDLPDLPDLPAPPNIPDPDEPPDFPNPNDIEGGGDAIKKTAEIIRQAQRFGRQSTLLTGGLSETGLVPGLAPGAATAAPAQSATRAAMREGTRAGVGAGVETISQQFDALEQQRLREGLTLESELPDMPTEPAPLPDGYTVVKAYETLPYEVVRDASGRQFLRNTLTGELVEDIVAGFAGAGSLI